jgi:cell wall assembly regulator SMI1
MDLKTIRDRWLSHEISVRDGASDATISDFERRYGVLLPEDVRRFYSLMDGIDNCETDDDWISFWPLSEIGSVPEKLSSLRGVPDYGGIESLLPDAAS